MRRVPDSQWIASFVGSIPEMYDRYMGPVFFDPSAADLVRRVDPAGTPILDLASGTGRLTAPLVRRVQPAAPPDIVALDLNAAMHQIARVRVPDPRIRRVVGNAFRLPFPDRVFAQAVCQYGVMFFPDKAAAAEEVRRVLRRGGVYRFNTWASLEDNPLMLAGLNGSARLYGGESLKFYHVPFGYFDPAVIRRDLERGGFTSIDIERVELTGHCTSAMEVATGLVKGSPILDEIRQRGTRTPDEVVDAVAEDIAAAFGSGPFDARLRAVVVTASAA
jgi:SAM-dependent methyltransferase